MLSPLLLGNEGLAWSVAHANASWNMSKHTKFAQLSTQAFWELNYHTLLMIRQ
jgi:hypothetical protein